LDDFYVDDSLAGRRARIEDDPGISNDQKLDALIGAIGEHLCHRWQLGIPPAWTEHPDRFLNHFWFFGEENDKAEFLRDSPSAYRRRMIFTEAEPLRRARMPRDGRWWAYEQLRGGLVPTPEEVEEFSKKPSPY